MVLEKAIYALLDPRNSEIYYVGASTDPARRYIQHLKGSSESTSEWIEKLRANNVLPDMRILCDFTPLWQEMEYKFISENRTNKLLNISGNRLSKYSLLRGTKPSSNVDQALATTLKLLREKKGISQSEVSTSLGVSQPTIANWENGKRSPTVSNLYAVSTAYETPTYKILEMAEQIDIGKEVLNGNSNKKKKKK